MLDLFRMKSGFVESMQIICMSFVLIAVLTALLLLTSCDLDSVDNLPENEINSHDPEAAEETAKSEAPGGPEKPENDHNHYRDDENAQAELKTVPKIALYSGSGSWDKNVDTLIDFFNSYEIEFGLLDENSITEPELLDNYEIIVLPGGFAAEYRYKITDHESIRIFVRNGGLFVGFCAGAYYAADIFVWQGTEYDYPLELFTGSSVGPLVGKIGWGEQALLNLNPDHPANEDFDLQLDIYYYDGPFFEPHEEDNVNIGTIEILAYYDVNNQPAVIAGRSGQGGYLLFGPHPEMDGYGRDEGANWPWLYSSLLWFANW